MLNAWPRIIMCRRLRDGNPCLKNKLEDLKHVGKMTFGRYKEHEHKQLEESGTNRDSMKKAVEQGRTLYRLWRFIRRI
jgi:hypothetical protein